MKRVILIALVFSGLSVPCFGQVALELVDSTTGLTTVPVVAGSSFSLNIEITGASTATLDSFDLTLSGSTTASTALPAGITLTSFSNLVSGFFGGPGGASNPDVYSAIANSTADDVAFSLTPTSILTANFTTSSALASGMYAIDFPPTGSFQNLYDADGNPITYTPLDATIDVADVPEPGVVEILLLAFAAMIAFRLLRAISCSRAAA